MNIGLLRGLIEDINASAQRDMPWCELMSKGVRQVDLPALFHQWTQRIDDSVALQTLRGYEVAKGQYLVCRPDRKHDDRYID